MLHVAIPRRWHLALRRVDEHELLSCGARKPGQRAKVAILAAKEPGKSFGANAGVLRPSAAVQSPAASGKLLTGAHLGQ